MELALGTPQMIWGVIHHTVWELSCGSLWAAPDRLSPWQGRGTEVEGGVLGGEGFG